MEKIKLTLVLKGGEYSFPFRYCFPKKKNNKTVVLLNFRDCFPDKYLPAEEVIDDGWAVADVCYNDVTSDDNDFSNGFAALFDRQKAGSAGKIVMWAYAAMRIADYLETREETDMNKKHWQIIMWGCFTVGLVLSCFNDLKLTTGFLVLRGILAVICLVCLVIIYAPEE